MRRAPSRGDILDLRLYPTGKRTAIHLLVLVLSPAAFNALGTVLVCPVMTIDESHRTHGFAVRVEDTNGTTLEGIVQCHRLRTISLPEVQYEVRGKAPRETMQDVLARVRTLVS